MTTSLGSLVSLSPARDKTIDSRGNIVPKAYGVSRWDYPRFYECKHDEDCENAATFLWRRLLGDNDQKSHNCCGEHTHPTQQLGDK